MNDLLQHPRLLIVLIMLPIAVSIYALISQKLGIVRDLKRGRINVRTVLFWLSIAATAFAITFLFLL